MKTRIVQSYKRSIGKHNAHTRDTRTINTKHWAHVVAYRSSKTNMETKNPQQKWHRAGTGSKERKINGQKRVRNPF